MYRLPHTERHCLCKIIWKATVKKKLRRSAFKFTHLLKFWVNYPFKYTCKQIVFPSEVSGLGFFWPHYQPPAVQGWLRFYQLFMLMCFPTNRNDRLFSTHCSGMRNWYWWVSFPLGNCFSGVVTMWRWKTISKALNRCCNYLTHTGILECDAPTVISLEEREGQDPLQTHEGCIQTNNALYREWTGPWLRMVEYTQTLKPTYIQHGWKMTRTETV